VQRSSHDSQHPRGCSITGGGVGEQACSGGAMLRRIFYPSEPAWETGDDRANLEGSQCVATSSPLDILLVGAPGACKSQPSQFFGVRVGSGARQVMLKRSWR